MSMIPAVFSVLLSAVLLSLGIPNELFKSGSALLGVAALVPLYFAFVRTPGWHRAGFLGGLMMMAVHLMSSFWLANFKEFAIFTLGASALACFAMGILAGWILRRCLAFPAAIRPFLFAAAWAVWEWFKSIGFFAYPWGTVIMTSRGLTPLIQIADLTGTWGISFLLALVSATLGEGLLHLTRQPLPVDSARPGEKRDPLVRTACFTAGLLILACSYGLVRISFPPPKETDLDIVMVQQNADSWEQGGVKKAILASEELTRNAISEAGKTPDLVVWSESVLPYPYLQYRKYYTRFPDEDPFGTFLSETGVPLLVGSPVLVDPEHEGYSNSAILLASDGQLMDWQAKIQLVPFAEYMPFTQYEFVRTFFDTLVGFSSGWVPGTEIKTLSVPDRNGKPVRFATPICFEDAFSALVAQYHNAGSDILINLTNDSWSKTDSAEMQHFVIASFRAIELRTTLVRSTNAGYSVVVDPLGKVIADLPLFTPASRFVSVPVYRHQTTFYARFGDWFPALLGILVSLAVLLDGIAGRRSGAVDSRSRLR